MEAVKRRREHSTILQHPPAYDPQSNGPVEKGVQDIVGEVKALKLGLEQRTGMKLETDMAILKWIIEWAPQVLNRCGIGADGNTAYKRRLGRTSRRPLVEICEQVMAKPLRAKKTSRKVSLASKWKFGTWVGIAERTGEHLVVLAKGGPAVKVRTVRRRSLDDRWNCEALREMVAVPRHPNPIRPEQVQAEACDNTEGVHGAVNLPETSSLQELFDSTQIDDVIGADIPEAVVADPFTKRRDFQITKNILDEFGRTPECTGCVKSSEGKRGWAHTIECRARLEAAMIENEGYRGRLDNRNARLKIGIETKTEAPESRVPSVREDIAETPVAFEEPAVLGD